MIPMISIRMDEAKKMWIEQSKVPSDLSRDEVVQFWAEMEYSHSARIATVKEFGKRFNLTTLIETGTFEGGTIQGCLDSFEKIISIEVDQKLCSKAQDKFSDYPHVTIIHGDSGETLPLVLKSINQPCLFWLDGHYVSGSPFGKSELDTPIWKELHHILNHTIRNHVILIDDARCYIGPNQVSVDYPTIQELEARVLQERPDLTFELRPDASDIIRIYRKQ